MKLALDHLFICTSLGGEEEASGLAAFGLTEGPPNVHPGQGTACRRFFFANFYLAFAQRPDSYPAAKRPPLHHRAGLRAVTRVEFTSPRADRLSPEITAVVDAGLVGLRPSSEYLVELGFDGEARGQQADFRPLLPLLLRW